MTDLRIVVEYSSLDVLTRMLLPPHHLSRIELKLQGFLVVSFLCRVSYPDDVHAFTFLL